jgi:N-acyl-D-aspartate/D-glutamate deacylase
MSSPSLVIRNGTIVDGTGGDPYEADLAVIDGKIAAVGGNIAKGTEEIDARGKLVTPGFVDVHTHYDAQVTWSDRLSPSSWNGATTVLFGNCGVGFAPCHEDQHDMLINLMEGVEDIPEVVLSEGLPWNWHSFPDFLDAIANRSYDVDVAAQVPHAALRVYVMGERGANREPATEQDRRRMAELTADGLRAGALGFSTSRTLNHRAADGRSIPTLRAEEAELTAIAHAMREAGTGWLQIVSDFEDQAGESACSAGWRRSRADPSPSRCCSPMSGPRAGARCWPRSTRPTRRACASPPRCARDRPACCWASSCRRTRSWDGRPTRRSPICRSRRGWPNCASLSSGRAS